MKLKIVTSLLISTLLLALALGVSPVTAHPTTFSLYPATVYSSAGSGFSVYLKVDAIVNCTGWNVTIEWAPGDFDCVGRPLIISTGLIPDWAWKFSNRGTVTDGKIFNLTAVAADWYGGSNVPGDPNMMAAISFTTERTPPDAGMPISITYAAYLNATHAWNTVTTVGALVKPPPTGKTMLEWLCHWTDPTELAFWFSLIAEYEGTVDPSVKITMSSVSFDDLWPTIVYRRSVGKDPDMYHMWDAWIADMVEAEMLAEPSTANQSYINANWHPAAKTGCTYRFVVWGYPTELAGEALVYNEKILNDTWGYANIPQGRPWTWDELLWGAKNATVRDGTGTITRAGLCFLDAPPNWPRFTFIELLWSNAGEEYALSPDREILWNSSLGLETLNFIHSLDNVTYTRGVDYGIWWGAWQWPEKIAIAILPNWFNYVAGAMGANYTRLKIAPIPIGPHGVNSSTHVYSWLNTVSKAAETRSDVVNVTRAKKAWEFLEWLNTPQPTAAPYGKYTTATWTTRMGDWLVYDSIFPSKLTDITQLTPFIQGEPAPRWLAGFGDVYAKYGRADEYFIGYADYSREMSVDLLEPIILAGADPATQVATVAPVVLKKLPIPGDINHDDQVDIFDLVICGVAFGSSPGTPGWDPRADVDNSGLVDIFDLVIIGGNFGRSDL